MPIKLTSSSFVAQSFIVVAACVATSSVAMAQTGSVLAWGLNNEVQCTIPTSANSGVAAIAGGAYHTIALKDRAVLAWGRNSEDQCTIPASANSGVSSIAGGEYHTIACDGLDCNVDGVLDTFEIAQDPTLDRNLNGTLDSCDIVANPAIDSNQNGIPDSVDLAAANARVTALTAQLNCGDLNGDGEVNGADLGKLIIGWGQCQ